MAPTLIQTKQRDLVYLYKCGVLFLVFTIPEKSKKPKDCENTTLEFVGVSLNPEIRKKSLVPKIRLKN